MDNHFYEAITNASNGAAVPNVTATLMGPATLAGTCSIVRDTTLCQWLADSCGYEAAGSGCTQLPGTVAAGTYTLEVSAPGFVTTRVSVTVAFQLDGECGCAGSTFAPGNMTLEPS